MYETVESINLNSKFDLEIDTLFGHITAEEFEIYLNLKYTKEMHVFVGVFTIIKADNLKEVFDDSNHIMHLVVFQDMKVNFDDYSESFRFIVKTFPFIDSKIDKEDALIKFIEAQKIKENADLLGIFPGNEISNSMIIFGQSENSLQTIQSAKDLLNL